MLAGAPFERAVMDTQEPTAAPPRGPAVRAATTRDEHSPTPSAGFFWDIVPSGPDTSPWLLQFAGPVQTVPRYQQILIQGAAPARMLQIVSGWAATWELADGRRQIQHICLPGDFAGVGDVFAPRQSYSVVTITAAQV